jgi:hypothetical protein
VKLHAEEMNQEIPIRWDPKEPFKMATKHAACDMVLGAKLWSSTP